MVVCNKFYLQIKFVANYHLHPRSNCYQTMLLFKSLHNQKNAACSQVKLPNLLPHPGSCRSSYMYLVAAGNASCNMVTGNATTNNIEFSRYSNNQYWMKIRTELQYIRSAIMYWQIYIPYLSVQIFVLQLQFWIPIYILKHCRQLIP